MNITVLDDYQNTVRTLDCFRKLAHHNVTIWNDYTKDMDVLAERLKDTEALALIRERTPIRAPLIDRLDHLRMISNVSVYPHIDVDACARRGIIVSSDLMPAKPSYATAELTWGLIIASLRRIPQEAAALKQGRWQAHSIGLGLRRKTLGIFGYGKLGRVVAGYGQAFGMKVLVWGRETTLTKARADGHATAASKDQLFEQSDVLSLHVRLLDDTQGIVAAGDLARMKPTSLFVNTSRAQLIEPGALEKALRAGRPGMAAVDVYEDEPILRACHPLLTMNNVICTPHLGYVERDGLDLICTTLFDQILAYANGRPINMVNPSAA
jgi:D-3-phosphoglycerate dehydrogenase / 2-oxoglutarate reductase